MLDDLDRQITAALIRNGRAPWRQIAEVLGQQERTVARRGNRLLESGLVRINAFANPSAWDEAHPYLVRVAAAPSALRGVGSWLAQRPDVSWASALAGASECVAEVFLPEGAPGHFLYGELAGLDGVRDVSLLPLFEYYRTVSGWRPPVLAAEQYLALHPGEDARLAARGSTPPDEVNRALMGLLRRNGRATVEELAAALSVSKATVSRRLEALSDSGGLFVRAVLDPAALGYPVEALLELDCEAGASESVGKAVAELSSTRWAATAGERILVQSAVAGLEDLRALVVEVHQLDGVRSVGFSLYAEIFKRSSVRYREGVMEAG